jgi:hypothetical protein
VLLIEGGNERPIEHPTHEHHAPSGTRHPSVALFVSDWRLTVNPTGDGVVHSC